MKLRLTFLFLWLTALRGFAANPSYQTLGIDISNLNFTNGIDLTAGDLNIAGSSRINASYLVTNNPSGAGTNLVGVNISTGTLYPMDSNSLVQVINDPVGKVVSGRMTNTVARSATGFSINEPSLFFFQKALNAAAIGSRKLRLMWFGDSTGGDSIQAHQYLLGSNYLYGIEPIPAVTGISAYFGFDANVYQLAAGASGNSTWWGDRLVLSNLSTTLTFGIRNSRPILADQCKVWYIANSGHGTETVYTSPESASNTWTLRATIDQTLGTAGIRATNISLTLDNYYVKISNSVAGTQSRTMLLWPQLEYSGSNSVSFFDGHVNGGTVSAWLDMGEVSIASLLTNYAPDVIYWQQTKDVATYDYFTNAAIYFNRYASNSDIVLIQSQESFDPAIAGLPASGGKFQLPVAREIALTNGWVFIDNCTPFLNWSNSVLKAQLGAYGDIHFTTAGALISGQMVTHQLGLFPRIANSGLLRPIVTTNFALLKGGNRFSGDQIITNGTLSVTNPIVTGGTAAGFKFQDRDDFADFGQWLMTGATTAKKISLRYDNFADSTRVMYFSIPFGTPLKWNADPGFTTFTVFDENPPALFASSGSVSNMGAAIGLGATNIFEVRQTNSAAINAALAVGTNGNTYVNQARTLSGGAANFNGAVALSGSFALGGGTAMVGIQKGVATLVTGTNRVSASFASVTNPILLTPHWRDATNFWVGVSNIIEGTSFDIVAMTNNVGTPKVMITTNTVGWMVVK